MAYTLATLFTLLCLTLSHDQASRSTPLTHHILLILPLQDVKEPSAGWERGHEILPGAQIAAEMINNSSTIEYQLQLIPVDSGRCENSISQFAFLPQLINSTFNQDLNIQAAIGFLCHNEFQVMLDSPSSISSIITKQLKMAQPVMLINTLLSFMQYMEWTGIGIMTELGLNDFFYFNTAEAIAKTIKGNLNVTISKIIQIPSIVYKIDYDLPKVLFLSVSPSMLVKVLCSAYKRDLLWPNHVWILHGYRLIDFQTDTTFSCNISRALEGAIVINEELTPVDNIERYNSFYNMYVEKLLDHSKLKNITLHPNMYAYVAYDLVWEIALTLSLRQKINGTVPYQQQRNSKMNIIQIKAKGYNSVIESLIATYSPHSGELNICDKEFKSTAPSDRLPLVILGVPPAYTVIFSIISVMVFVIETSVLIVYICFRKEPEIKSTSFSLSLLMFIGCYLCNIYTPVVLYFQQPFIGHLEMEDGLCHVRLWLSSTGLYFIEVTLLVKLLRVYRIFFRYKAKPIGRECSDIFLACYVLIILSPSIIIHVLWSLLDSYGFILVQTPMQTYIKSCGPVKPVWTILLIVYGNSISIALVTVAIKTRKIRHKQFKDSRKVNIYLFCFTFVSAMTFGYWFLLDRSNTYEYYLSFIPVHIGLSLMVLLCQFLLFVPKVFPPFQRYIMAMCFNK